MSILILAFSQKPVENSFQLTLFRALTAILGVALSFVWLLIQHRSSKYILHYKTQARRLAKLTNTTDMYPEELGGIEMRKLAYALPSAFLLIWLTFFFTVLVNL
jgi:amino acid permease